MRSGVTSSKALRRGDIVRVRLDPVESSEQAGDRPGLVLSPDLINQHSPVVLVAPITSKKTENIYPFEALIDYGTVDAPTLERVDAARRIAAGLTRIT